MEKLCVLVPYRDREEHLRRLVPRLRSVLDQQFVSKKGMYEIVVVEQNDSEPFNKGALLNAGFLVMRESFDYVCFHDVDFVPIDADYSKPGLPTRRIWEGAESRPREPGGVHFINHQFDWFFGGVLLFSSEHFRAVNGFSNRYRGWGYEDGDLRERCRYQGLGPVFDHGSFEALDHVNRGIDVTLSFTAEAMANRDRYQARWGADAGEPDHQSDGLNTIRFEHSENPMLLSSILGRQAAKGVRHLLINIGHPVTHER